MSCHCNTYGCKCEKWCPNCNGENTEKIEMCLCCVVNKLKHEQNDYNRRLNATINNLVNNVYNKVVNKVTGDVEQKAEISIGISETGEYKCLIQNGEKIDYSNMYNPDLGNCDGFKINIKENETYLIKINGISNEQDDVISAPYRNIKISIEGDEYKYESEWINNNQ